MAASIAARPLARPRVRRAAHSTLAAVAVAALVLASPSAADPTVPAVGPVGPLGFPIWIHDASGLQVEPCLDPADPFCPAPIGIPHPSAPLSIPDNFPDEFFYWTAAASAGPASLTLALEGAFASVTGGPEANQQILFARTRVRAQHLVAGATYTVTLPLGEPLEITADAIGQLRFTEDIGAIPGQFEGAWAGRITHLLVAAGAMAPGHLGNSSTESPVTGSPTGRNFFRIEGPGVGDAGCVPPRDGCAETSLFAVSGKVFEQGGGDATHLLVTGLSNGVAGEPQTALVVAQDALDNVATAYAGTVHLSLALPDVGATLARDAPLVERTGVGAFRVTPTRAGEWTLVASDAADLRGKQTILVSPAAPASLTALSGDDQTSLVATTLPGALSARVADAFGNGVAGVPVTFAPATAGAAIVATRDVFVEEDGTATVLTSPLGVAAVRAKLSPGAGDHRFTASAPGPAAVSFVEHATAGEAARIDLDGLVPTLTAGETADLLVSVRDAFGNTAAGFAGVVTLSSDDPLASLSAASIAAVGGVAAVPVTVTFRSAGPRTVVATVGDAGALSRAATAIVMPGPATSLALVSAPTAIEAGRTSASPVVVAVTDAFGNGVPAVAIAFRAVTGGAIAPSATTDANGRASASVTGAADNGSYTFEASAPGLGTVSALVQVTGGTTPVAAPPPPAPHASGGGCSTGGGVDGAWAIAAAVAVLRHARRAWQRK